MSEKGERARANAAAWAELNRTALKDDGSDEYKAMQWAFEIAFNEGYHFAKQKTAVELVNVYYSTAYKWFAWLGRNSRVKAYIDRLWDRYGLEVDEE